MLGLYLKINAVNRDGTLGLFCFVSNYWQHFATVCVWMNDDQEPSRGLPRRNRRKRILAGVALATESGQTELGERPGEMGERPGEMGERPGEMGERPGLGGRP